MRDFPPAFDSQDLLRFVLADAPLTVLVLDAEGRVAFSGGNGLEAIGLDPEKLTGKPIGDLFKGNAAALRVFRRALSGEAFRTSMELSGATFDARFEPLGGPAGTAALLTNLTERHRKAEAALAESELRFRQIAEHVGEVFWMTDLAKTRTLYVSPAYEKVWGRSCESLYLNPTSFLEGIHPEDRERVRRAFPKQVEGLFDEEYRVLRPDGSVRWVRDKAFPIRDSSGESYRMAGIAADITELKLQEKALRESIERFAMAAEGSADGIWEAAIDLERWKSPENEMYISPRAKELVGFGDDELPNRLGSFLERLHPEDYDRTMDLLEKRMREGGIFDTEFRLATKSGRYRWFQCRGRAHRDEAGRPHRMAGSLRDVTERKLAEERVAELNRFLDSVIENLPDMIFIKDAEELRFVRFNRAGEELLGRSRQELIGRSDYDFFPKEQADFFTSKDREVLSIGRLLDISEEPIDTLAGRRILHTKKIPIADPQGKPQYLLGISEDITERKKIEKEHRRLARITAMSPDAVVEAGLDMRVTYWNPAAEKMFGYLAEEVLGRPILEFFVPPEEVHVSLAAFAADPKTPPAVLVDRNTERLHKSGRRVPVIMTAFPILDEEGRYVSRAAIFHDMTALKKMEAALLEKSKMAAIGQMAAGVAHEIRNPLFGISSVAQILSRESELAPEARELTSQMLEEIARLRKLLDNLLLYARPRRLNAVPVLPSELCRETFEFHRPLFEQKNLKVEKRCGPENARIRIDGAQMRQVLLNLCMNAVQASPEGGTIRVESDLEPGTPPRWTFRILNRGEPIRPEHVSLIFDPFFSTRREGSGLGLAVCRKIVEDHGGKIEVECSDPSKTVFRFSIPVEVCRD